MDGSDKFDEVLIHFRLVGAEARALRRLSIMEMRKPSHQVKFMVRKELQERGLLEPSLVPPAEHA